MVLGAALLREQPSSPTDVATGGPRSLIERNYRVYRRGWVFFLTGFVEPVLWLLSIGVGVGALVAGFDVGGRTIPYAEFVAPGMLAASAMNGAVIDSTFNIFFKLRYLKVYDAALATPLRPVDVARGEITWAVLRGGIYSAGFLGIMLLMGLVSSWWAVLALPAALLLAFAFAGAGMALTTFMRSWQDFEYVTLATLPMFLFSATFFPVEAYPGVWRWVVEATPLYRGVVLIRDLCIGAPSLDSAVSVAYLFVMGALGTAVAARRIGRLLLA